MDESTSWKPRLLQYLTHDCPKKRKGGGQAKKGGRSRQAGIGGKHRCIVTSRSTCVAEDGVSPTFPLPLCVRYVPSSTVPLAFFALSGVASLVPAMTLWPRWTGFPGRNSGESLTCFCPMAFPSLLLVPPQVFSLPVTASPVCITFAQSLSMTRYLARTIRITNHRPPAFFRRCMTIQE